MTSNTSKLNLKLSKKQIITVAALIAVGTALYATVPTGMAANDADFGDIWLLITGWATGTLGKTIAVAFILVGIIGGLTRQSLMAFATGVGAGVGLLYFPTIINTIFTATLSIS